MYMHTLLPTVSDDIRAGLEMLLQLLQLDHSEAMEEVLQCPDHPIWEVHMDAACALAGKVPRGHDRVLPVLMLACTGANPPQWR